MNEIEEISVIEEMRDELGRWTKRIFSDGSFEVYSYKYSVEMVLSNPIKYNNSFAIESIHKEEVTNG